MGDMMDRELLGIGRHFSLGNFVLLPVRCKKAAARVQGGWELS